MYTNFHNSSFIPHETGYYISQYSKIFMHDSDCLSKKLFLFDCVSQSKVDDRMQKYLLRFFYLNAKNLIFIAMYSFIFSSYIVSNVPLFYLSSRKDHIMCATIKAMTETELDYVFSHAYIRNCDLFCSLNFSIKLAFQLKKATKKCTFKCVSDIDRNPLFFGNVANAYGLLC